MTPVDRSTVSRPDRPECKTPRLLDFHTHRTGCEYYRGTDTIIVQSTYLSEEPCPRADYYTTGIHPMEVEEAKQVLGRGVEYLREVIFAKREQTSAPLLALGELGWDNRSSGLSLSEQSKLVSWQLDLAEELGLPVVFHIVGGWDLLLAEQRSRTRHTAWWVHGFRGKPGLLDQLRRAGISVGLSPRYTWGSCPEPGSFLLETDEEIGTLAESYRRAGIALGMRPDLLAHHLLSTFAELVERHHLPLSRSLCL